ncbi:MAG: hypothetical protein AB8C84_03655 [Oligoflexales bacterium]
MQHYHIAIFGSGVTARTLAHHLKTSSLKFICISPHTFLGPGLCAGGSLDNWTRLHHTLGAKHAQSLWDLSQRGLSGIEKFSQQQGVPFLKSHRIRISQNSHEDEEMHVAHQLLQNRGIHSSLSTYGQHNLHMDQTQSSWIDENSFLEKLHPASSIQKESFIRVKTTDPLQIETSHRTLTADALVFTDHQDLIQASARFADIVIPYTDQWHTFQGHSPWAAGTVFSSLHGAYWGVVESKARIHFGGARFLRPWNIQKPEILDSIQLKLQTELEQLTGCSASAVSSHLHMRCAPQDEYPLLGHWGQAGHVFIAMGWGSWELSCGFAAGEIMSEILTTGTTHFPCQRFHPARFTSY